MKDAPIRFRSEDQVPPLRQAQGLEKGGRRVAQAIVVQAQVSQAGRAAEEVRRQAGQLIEGQPQALQLIEVAEEVGGQGRQRVAA